MGRVRSLNSIPNEIVQKYLSTTIHYDKGYMPDWLWKKMNELGIEEAEIDLFKETISPIELKSKPVIYYLPELRKLIKKQLITKGFKEDYINYGIFKISIHNMGNPYGVVTIQCVLKSTDNKNFYGKIYKQRTYPIADSFFDKIIKLIK